MDVTKKCTVSEKHGFDVGMKNRFAVLEVEAKNGDMIKVNEIKEINYNEIFDAYEYPNHEDRPIVDLGRKVVVLGGEEETTSHTIFIIGK
ncbi:MAG: hypothetical protein COV47_05125 [Candidatus Diapherotrites archaeon CG11_big_fil_rev_8_21_14_0_20_37_9]|nr:MAG: hypothetical protein COV47_05125 [Candidatus Diapherotrites archaeon CG11_big_fil_rev_8_21_14_0_20_37_9]